MNLCIRSPDFQTGETIARFNIAMTAQRGVMDGCTRAKTLYLRSCIYSYRETSPLAQNGLRENESGLDTLLAS